MSDYYKHIYSQRDIDLIRGDLMQRIAELTTERDALVEAVRAMEDQSTTVDEDGEDRCTQCGWYAYAHEPACVFALAVKLKEQDDEASL